MAMDDKKLRQDVIDELAFEPSLNAETVGVAAERGIVTLSGHVESYPQKMAAERAVWRVKGVKGIAQEIEVRLPGHKRRADDEIAQRAISILAWNTEVPADAVKVRVSEGWVTLTGDVSWNHQRLAAERAVRELSGVVGIINRIELASPVQPSDVKQRIAAALARHAKVEADRIGIAVDGGTVTLTGDVDNWDERVAVEGAAWSVNGVRSVVDRLHIV
ncbi:BON domain-containing protein [Tahibacter caeni]|uniref:BON domain-containing protein n=1 Tax=Tahibacter caeni TaxID=1453545 RepID=UPI002147D396|nr:BON domain-containing protein [Tahibacter caeni]